jgi:hypothetical protein
VNVDGSDGRTGGWAAAGPAGGDTAYRTQSLKFLPVETSLDESVSLRTLFELWLRAAIVSVTIWVVFFFIWLIGAVGTLNALSSGSDIGGAGNALGGLFVVGQLIAFVVFWVLLLAPQMAEPIAEWRTLLENKAGAAGSAYAAVYGSLARRRIPVNAAAVRVRSDVLAPEVVNNRLIITERSYVVYISVFPYGTSLYVGWSMYRNRRGATLIGIFFKDLVGSFVGRTGLINQMLRTEKVRAMREAVHSAVREGVEVAVQGVEVPIVATFGHEVPVQNLSMGAPAPIPAAWGPVSGPPAPEPVPPQNGPAPAGY